jgi:magnesium transporter
MIRTLYCPKDASQVTEIHPSEFRALLSDDTGFLWVDFEGEPPENCESILRETFGFHALAIDDALRETHVPKVDDWDKYLYIALHAIALEGGREMKMSTHEFDVFLGKNYLVSHHDSPLPAVDRVRNRCQRDRRHLTEGPDHVVYLLADELVAEFMQVYEKIDDEYDLIEDEIFERPRPETLERILLLKRVVLKLRRTLAPQREVLNKLARDDFDVIDSRDRVFFRDVYDHLVRLFDINESMRDQVGGALETYLSVINNRMNEVMKALTIITTLFMPISFVAGFFGMNFFQPVARLNTWTGETAFAITLAITALAPIAILVWARRKEWL